MGKKLLLILLTFIITPLYAQNGWFTQSSGTSLTLNSVFMLSDNTGYIGGGDILIDNSNTLDRGAILKTTNGGINWFNLVPPTFDKIIHSVYFVNEQTGYAVGRDNNSYAIFKTTNEGSSWIQQTPPAVTMTPPLNSVYFFDPNTGYTAGTGGAVFYTSDGGTNWISRNLSFFTNLTAIYFTDVNTGFLSADNSVLKTTNGGTDWDTTLFAAARTFKSVIFLTQNTGYAVGGSSVYMTINGGVNWTIVSLPGNDLQTVFFPSVATGYTAGIGNGIYKTIDEGENWTLQSQTGSNAINSMYFINDTLGYAVGNGGMILKTINGGSVGITNLSTEIPDMHILKQNYPNPFNPETNIEYSIPENSDVRLTLYDASGKTVFEFFRGFQTAGTYRYKFNAAGLAGGVYFYRLLAGDFSSAKKMILLK